MYKTNQRTVNGILLLNKPKGLTSNAILQKVKNLYDAKKAGHTGSLDPIATGMLPICFGEATKFSEYLLNADKHYKVSAKLGIKTITGDCEGEVIETRVIPELNVKTLEKILESFRRKSIQIPPMYSAIKHQGQPLYKLARKGIEVSRTARKIIITQLLLKSFTKNNIVLDVKCSKGTYIRTLVEDIGEALGCGAHVTILHRVGAGLYLSDNMINFKNLEALAIQKDFESLDRLLLPIESAVAHLPIANISDSAALYLQQGRIISSIEKLKPGLVQLKISQNYFIGLGEVLKDGRVAAKRLLAHCVSSDIKI